MGNKGQGVHLIAVEEHVHLHQIAGPVALDLIVQRGISLGVGLEGVEEIIDDLVEGHGVVDLHQIGIQILHILELTPAVLTHGHDVAHIVGRGNDGNLGVRLPGLFNDGRVGVVVGVIHMDHGAVGLGDLVDDGGQGGHQIQVEFPLQTLLDDLHMKHTQKSAAETKAQRHGGFRFKGEGGVVELELFQGVPQVGILGAVLGIHAAVDHGLDRTVTGQGLGGGTVGFGDGVAHPGILHVFDGGGEVTHLAGGEGVGRFHAQRAEVAALDDLIRSAGGHHLHLHTGAHRALHDAEIDDHAPVGVILAVEDQRLEGSVRVAGGGGNVVHDILQHVLDVDAHFGGDLGGVQGGKGKHVFNLVLDPLGIGGGQVDLIHHRADLQVVFHGQIGVGQGLGLDALGGVHHQNGALTGRQRTGDLIVEVHVTRGVDKVEFVLQAIQGVIVELDRAGLDGNAPLPLQIHVVQQLGLHLPLGDGVAQLDQPVGEGGFTVVDMGDDGKVADFALITHKFKTSKQERSFLGVAPGINEVIDPGAGVVDDLEKRLVQSGIVLGKGVVIHGREGALFFLVPLQRLDKGHPGGGHVHDGDAGIEGGGRDGEKVLVLGAAGPEQIAKNVVNGSGQIFRGGFGGAFGTGFAQQVKENAQRVDQQLFVQGGHDAAVQHIVLFSGSVVEFVGGDNGGAVLGQRAPQKKVGRDVVVITGAGHKGKTRFPDAVFIMRQQRLADAQILGCRPLGNALFLAEERKTA